MPEGIGFLEKQKNGKQWLGCLSDLVSLDSSYQKAVNAALGDSMSYYVCQSLEEAKEGIASLTRSNKGKVHFLVLDLVTNGIDVDYPDINGAKKTLEVIDYPPELYTALRLILGKSYIVPDLRVAETLALKYPDSSFVTSDGEKFIGKGLVVRRKLKKQRGVAIRKKILT